MEKRKKGPPNSCQFKWRVFEETQAVFQSVFMFIEYRNTVLLKGAYGWSEINQVKSFPYIQNRNLQLDIVQPCQTMFGFARENPKHS
jgi:hypothetical protein